MRTRWHAWRTKLRIARVARGWISGRMAAEIRHARSAYDDAYLARIYATQEANVTYSSWTNGTGPDEPVRAARQRQAEARAVEVECARRFQDLTGEDMLDGRWPTADELRLMLSPVWNPTRDFRGRPVPSGGAWITVRSPRGDPPPVQGHGTDDIVD